METALTLTAAVALLLGLYALTDWALRGRGLERLAVAARVPARRAWLPWALGAAALSPLWSWPETPGWGGLRLAGLVLLVALCWKACTRDLDPVGDAGDGWARLVLIASAAVAPFSPAGLVLGALMLSSPFALWQHHATLPMRLLQAYVAGLLLALGVGLSAPEQAQELELAFFFLLLTIQGSHYWITAWAKSRLGPKWYSWVLDNRLHHLAASAYSWGWARFLPWSVWSRVVHAVRRLERPLQALTWAVEAAAPLAFLSQPLAIGLSLTWACFHVGVFALSGLLFWEWVVADVALAGALFALPPQVAERLFGPGAALTAATLMLMLPLRHKLWKPMPLGWYDTPFTQRIHWRVQGRSGKEYSLYNDFMGPHERLYGKVHGCFYAPVPVVTYHLGEVWKAELREAIVRAGPDLDGLARVRDEFGILPRCPDLAERHSNYLRRFFYELNRGARKSFLPRCLSWVKAPGGQIYRWGEGLPYARQEPVSRVSLWYREEYFDGESLRRLRNERVLEVEVDMEEPPPQAAREPSPKELDDFLLRLANGRLIDLPGFAEGFRCSDDGRRLA